MTCECNSSLTILRTINKMWCQERERKTHRNETPDPRIYTSRFIFLQPCTKYISSLSCFTQPARLHMLTWIIYECALYGMLIESVLKHQICTFFIRIKWNKMKFVRMRNVFLHSMRTNTILCCVPFWLFLFMGRVCLPLFCVAAMFEAWHGSLRYMMGSMLHTPYHIWLTVNNLHITHVNTHTHSHIQWPLCACDEFLCIWIKCCSTHMITEKSHSATAIKAAKNWIYSHYILAHFFPLSSLTRKWKCVRWMVLQSQCLQLFFVYFSSSFVFSILLIDFTVE